ncbi:uncharacterized protein LOC144109885 [Amblyomma americanum]
MGPVAGVEVAFDVCGLASLAASFAASCKLSVQVPVENKKRRLYSSSSSGDDESLCSSSELRQAISSKKYWKEMARKLEANKEFLKKQAVSLQRRIESKIFNYTLASSMQASPTKKQSDAAPAQPSCVPEQDFTHLADGSFHLAKGVVLSAASALKIMSARKPTIACNDTAQAIWTSEVLATRSLSGNVAPTERGLGEPPRQPLTPEKVGLVAEMVRYWGRKKCGNVE